MDAALYDTTLERKAGQKGIPLDRQLPFDIQGV
jgi:hypothetical protein